jgi:hypothetical protein
VKEVVFVQAMLPQFVLVVLLFLLQSCSSTQPSTSMSHSPDSSHAHSSEVASAATTASSSQMVDFKLSDHQWRHRLVLVFASSNRSSDYQRQLQLWQSDLAGVRERDLKLVEILETGESRIDEQVIPSTAAVQLRRRFGIASEQFAVILVGKDGTEKQRSSTPIELAELFGIIDAMPMRQQEMRSRH